MTGTGGPSMPPSRAPSPPRGGMDDAISRNDAFMEKVLDRMTKLMMNGRGAPAAVEEEEEDVFESSDDDTIKSCDEEGATTTAAAAQCCCCSELTILRSTTKSDARTRSRHKPKGGRVGKKQGKKIIPPYLP